MRIHYAVTFRGESGAEAFDADHPVHVGEILPKRFKADKSWRVVRVFHNVKFNSSRSPENIESGTLEVEAS
ncbi:MAG TPA: hypothetical protein VJN93_01965 [Candidatus Acidoferrum sp.]|nr:hypothetical protein [Candidatus Acidoferrum sp.]